MGKKFPNVDWWCDRCNSSLNGQSEFDDHSFLQMIPNPLFTVFPDYRKIITQ